MTGDRDLLAAEEGLFTGEARAGEAPGPEPLPGAMDEVEEGGGGRGLGWAGSVGGLAEATICGWDSGGGACICAFPGTGASRAGCVACGGTGSWLAGGTGTGGLGCWAFVATCSCVGGSPIGGCGGYCSVGGRGAVGRPAGGSLPGSGGGGVCRLAAFCTGGPVDGSYCCWLCFCPASWAA